MASLPGAASPNASSLASTSTVAVVSVGIYSQRAEIRNTFGSGGAPIPGPFPGPASGKLLMLEARRGHKSPFVPYLAFLLAVPRLYRCPPAQTCSSIDFFEPDPPSRIEQIDAGGGLGGKDLRLFRRSSDDGDENRRRRPRALAVLGLRGAVFPRPPPASICSILDGGSGSKKSMPEEVWEDRRRKISYSQPAE